MGASRTFSLTNKIAQGAFSLYCAMFLFACGSRQGQHGHAPGTKLQETFDQDNQPASFSLKPLNYSDLASEKAREGVLPEKPWADSYWPFYRKNIASRYVTGQDFSSFEEQVRDATSLNDSSFLSPAEKYDLMTQDSQFHLTKESWDRYKQFSQIYGPDTRGWSWMGICSGWAPAALAEKKPHHPVMATPRQGKPILFFDGDLRALLSKAYDLNATSGGFQFGGSRCDFSEGSLLRDQNGRIVDGIVTNTGESFTIVNDHGRARGILEVRSNYADQASDTYFWASDKPFEHLGGEQWAFKYEQRADLALDLAEGTLGTHATLLQARYLRLEKNCRDVNPASLHMSLVQTLSNAASSKSSFVLEISRGQEVWNHPIWAFQTRVGTPVSISREPMERRLLRAPLTTHTASVETKIAYVSGIEPEPLYASAEATPLTWDQLEAQGHPILELRYDLEFDAAGQVIGGEWQEGRGPRQDTPDFFWRPVGYLTDENKDRTAPSELKYSRLRTLLDCSQREPDMVTRLPLSGTPTDLPVVRCDLP